jgi:hypothetical protein
MTKEESNVIKFVRIHEDVYISESAICEIHFSHQAETETSVNPGGGFVERPTGHKMLVAEIITISGQKRSAHGKFAEDLLRLLQASANPN